MFARINFRLMNNCTLNEWQYMCEQIKYNLIVRFKPLNNFAVLAYTHHFQHAINPF